MITFNCCFRSSFAFCIFFHFVLVLLLRRPPPDKGTKYCDEPSWVCSSVCLSDRLSVCLSPGVSLTPHVQTSRNFLYSVIRLSGDAWLEVHFSTRTRTSQGVAVRCLRYRSTPPTFLIWNNLCDLVYQTPTKTYRSQIPVTFGIPGHVTTKRLPDTPC